MVPIMQENTPKLIYIMPIFLWLVVKTHFSKKGGKAKLIQFFKANNMENGAFINITGIIFS